MKLSPIVVACVAIATALPSHALRTLGDATPSTGLPSAVDYSANLLQEIDGTVSWRTLAEVESISANGKVMPKFSKAILKLDKTDVRIYGFIVPLNLGVDQKHFLVSAVPPHCSFCMPAGPDAIVEVLSKKPVQFGFEPVLVSGKLTVLRDDPSGLLYRMTDAMQVSPGTSVP